MEMHSLAKKIVKKIKTTFNCICPQNMKTLYYKNIKMARMPLKWLPTFLTGNRTVIYAVAQITGRQPPPSPHDSIIGVP
jgi:hypothetical protein